MAKQPVNDFDFLTVEYPRRLKVTKVRARKKRSKKVQVKRVYFPNPVVETRTPKPRKVRAKHAIERRPDYYSETIAAPFEYDECLHEHHMNCIRCGLVQFMIGFVTGLTMALLIARVLY